MAEYGDAAKALWPLEPEMIFLNHGSYGATPHEVLTKQVHWRDRLEAQPCRFINVEAPAEMRRVADQLGAFVRARGEDIALVENTTNGINAVVKSLHFQAGDEIVVADHIYNAVRNTLRFVLDPVGATMVVAPIGLPLRDPEAIAVIILAAVTPRTRLIVVDHAASVSGVIFPVAEIAERARQMGLPVLVDGAHAPGMLDLDVPSLGVDWYVGNCHKWLCAPKGAAFLWVTPERQKDLHPNVISHDLGKGFTYEFDKTGTRDASAWLSIPAALEFHAKMGGAKLRARNHDVAVRSGRALAKRWDTETGAPDSLFGSMVTVRIPGDLPADRTTADALKAWLWAEHRAEIHIMPFSDALWVRISVQAYNTEDECLAVGPLVEAAVAAIA